MVELDDGSRAQTSVIAVLVTSHNRRDTTMRCLESLAAQAGVSARIEVFLVDDGSTDGTGDAVRSRFPGTNVIDGDGSLYWAGGTREAWRAAAETAPDFFMWLNDDVELDAGAVAGLLRVHEGVGGESAFGVIVCGATCDPSTGATTYGGVRRLHRARPMRFTVLEPSAAPQRCDTMNGNIVLVPAAVSERVGHLDERFRHAIADFDYGLRASATGVAIWVAPGYLGRCRENLPDGTYRDTTLPFRRRVRHLLTVKGLPPREWLVFVRRHGGVLWPLFTISPFVRVAASSAGAFVGSLARRLAKPSRPAAEVDR
jgi:GT2 family glycosyltransferase